jgi:predicted transcriptional regulator
MPKNQAKAAAEESPPLPLTAAEKAAIRRSEADIAAGRVHDHDDVSARLRQRAVEVVDRARRSGKMT